MINGWSKKQRKEIAERGNKKKDETQQKKQLLLYWCKTNITNPNNDGKNTMK